MTGPSGPGGSTGRAFAVVTGGGTAGHVLPALAVAEALVDRGHAVEEIHYVGALRGIETRLVPPTGFPHTFLDVVGVQRGMARSNLSFPTKLARAERAAAVLLRRLRPRVVVSVGGYASLPAVLARAPAPRPRRRRQLRQPSGSGQPAGRPLRCGIGRGLPRVHPAPGQAHRRPAPPGRAGGGSRPRPRSRSRRPRPPGGPLRAARGRRIAWIGPAQRRRAGLRRLLAGATGGSPCATSWGSATWTRPPGPPAARPRHPVQTASCTP